MTGTTHLARSNKAGDADEDVLHVGGVQIVGLNARQNTHPATLAARLRQPPPMSANDFSNKIRRR